MLKDYKDVVRDAAFSPVSEAALQNHAHPPVQRYAVIRMALPTCVADHIVGRRGQLVIELQSEHISGRKGMTPVLPSVAPPAASNDGAAAGLGRHEQTRANKRDAYTRCR